MKNKKLIPARLFGTAGEKNQTRTREPLPLFVWIFSLVSFLVGLLVVLLSSFHYPLDIRLRQEYLFNKAQIVAGYVESQLQGPQRRSLESLPSLLSEVNQRYQSQVLFLGIFDRGGNYTHHTDSNQVGRPSAHQSFAMPAGSAPSRASFLYSSEDSQKKVFLVSTSLMIPGVGGMGRGFGMGGSSTRILDVAIPTEIADFILIQARWQILFSVMAFFLLVGFSFFLPVAARRFLEMQSEQEQHRHWAHMGRLSAALAHEIRNPLGAIKGLSQLLMGRMKPASQEREFADTIVSETRRLEDLVHSLLSFARLPEPRKEKTDLVALVRQVLEDIRIELEKSGIRSGFQSAQPQEWALVDSNQIRQVLWNLFLNARDAMSSGGNLEVSLQPLRGKDGVTLRVQDSGSGFSAEALAHLFEPFFTTKAQGNGLGHAISQQIIQRHGGTISIENVPQGGALCTIYLPRGASESKK